MVLGWALGLWVECDVRLPRGGRLTGWAKTFRYNILGPSVYSVQESLADLRPLVVSRAWSARHDNFAIISLPPTAFGIATNEKTGSILHAVGFLVGGVMDGAGRVEARREWYASIRDEPVHLSVLLDEFRPCLAIGKGKVQDMKASAGHVDDDDVSSV